MRRALCYSHTSLFNVRALSRVAMATTRNNSFAYVKTRKFHSDGELKRALENNGVKVGRLNHVAIAVPNLEESTALYRDVLGAKVSAKMDLPEHGVSTVFVELSNTKIELLLPLGDQSPIANFLKSKPAGGIHHVCLEVDDVDEAHAALTASGLRILDKKPKIGAHGVPVFFIHPKEFNGVLVELEQAQSK